MEDQGLYVTKGEGELVISPQYNSLISVEQDRAVAEVQAAIVIAKRYPRDGIKAIDKITNACTRPGLAEKALYQYARGGSDITGPSIRLAEVIAQNWGNLVCGVTELTRRTGESDCMAYAWDLESNFRDEKRFTVRHVRDTKRGVVRLESERDLYELIANMGARRKRACILAVIPGDVVEAAEKQCEATLAAKAAVTPDRIETMLERFAEFGVTKAQIEKRIQRHLESMTPAQLVNLGKVYNSLKDGMSSPSDWFETEAPLVGPKNGLDALKDKLRAGTETPKQEPEKKASEEPPTYAPAVTCKICNFKASSPQGLKRHMTQQHPAPAGNVNETPTPAVVATTSSGIPPLVDFNTEENPPAQENPRVSLQAEIRRYSDILEADYWTAISTYYKGWDSDQANLSILDKMLDQCKKAWARQEQG